MPPAEDVHPRESTLAEDLWAVMHRLRHASAEAFAPLDITPGQARALGMLARHGELRMSVLSEHLRIAARSGTEVVDELERRGLAGRRPDPEDRRAVLVAPTPAGLALADRVRAARATASEAYFARLDPGDRAALARILRTLVEDPDEG